MNAHRLAATLAIAAATLVCVDVATARATKAPGEIDVDRAVDAALKSLRTSGAGAKSAAGRAAMARAISTTTLNNDIYAFGFDQSRLMAGLQASKITKIKP